MQRLTTTLRTKAPLTEAYLFAGTITLLIIRHDERTGRYRSQSGILQHYTRMNQLPEVNCCLDGGKGPLWWPDLPIKSPVAERLRVCSQNQGSVGGLGQGSPASAVLHRSHSSIQERYAAG